MIAYCTAEKKNVKARFLDCDEHKQNCDKIVCCNCGADAKISNMAYEVSTSYTMKINAKNKEEAKQLFIELLDTVDPNWVEDQIEVKKV